MNLQSRIVFHHVARAGGFEAARPALNGLEVSGVRKHVRALERELGVALFHRQPFRLTPEGRTLYEQDRPHLEALGLGAELFRRRARPRLRAGLTGSAAKMFLLPAIQDWLHQPGREPIESRLSTFRELRPALENRELDLLVTALDGPPPEGFALHTLARFSLVLLVPESSPVETADALWARPDAAGLLVTPEPEDPVTLAFERGLARGDLSWPSRLTCDSPASVVRLVAAGLGIGLALSAESLPPAARPSGNRTLRLSGHPTHRSRTPGIRELALPGFDPVSIVALWRLQDNFRLKAPLTMLKAHCAERGAWSS
jgi:DNA-binding transcriptional LysR family regulator